MPETLCDFVCCIKWAGVRPGHLNSPVEPQAWLLPGEKQQDITRAGSSSPTCSEVSSTTFGRGSAGEEGWAQETECEGSPRRRAARSSGCVQNKPAFQERRCLPHFLKFKGTVTTVPSSKPTTAESLGGGRKKCSLFFVPTGSSQVQAVGFPSPFPTERTCSFPSQHSPTPSHFPGDAFHATIARGQSGHVGVTDEAPVAG